MRNSNKNQVELYFIRHAKTAGNNEGRYIGRTDEELCEEGKLSLLTKDYPDACFVFSSPMKRCLSTAEIIYPKLVKIIIDEFSEMDFGDFEGKNYAELNGNEDYQRFIDSGGTIAFPNGESREEFCSRVMLGYEKMLKIIKEKGLKNVAVVVHGGTIMAILSNILGGEYFDYQIKNGEVYRCNITL